MSEENNVVDQTEATQAPVANPDLTISDLAAIKNLIDVVTTRGAFKGEELSSVGVLYDKLNKFLTAVQAQAQQQQTAESN
jgi:hypothetical protein